MRKGFVAPRRKLFYRYTNLAEGNLVQELDGKSNHTGVAKTSFTVVSRSLLVTRKTSQDFKPTVDDIDIICMS